jgi:hypothetical protein
MRHQRVLVMDDRHWTMRVLDQVGAHRSQQAACQGPSAPGADDEHKGLFGEIDQGRNDGRKQHFGFDLSRTAIRGVLPRHLDRVVNDALRMLLLPLNEA